MEPRSLAMLSRWRLLALAASAAALLLFASPVQAGVLGGPWDAPTTNEDATPLDDLWTYRVYFGLSNPPCPTSSYWEIASPTAAPTPGTVVTFGLSELVTGNVYFVQVTAVATSGIESVCSAFATGVARPDPADTTLPPAPAPLTVFHLQPTPPDVTITFPTSNPTLNTGFQSLALSGTASDNVGVT